MVYPELLPAPLGAPAPLRSPRTPRAALVHIAPNADDRMFQLEAMLQVAGTDAVVSHAAAVHLWGFPETTPWRSEVSTRRCDRYRVRKVRAHRSVELTDDDITTLRDLPVTTLARTVIDLSARVSPWRILDLTQRGIARGLLDADDLEAGVQRLRQAPGRRLSVVRDAVAGVRTRSGRSALAQRVDAITQAAGLPTLTWNVHLSNGSDHHRAELAYPGARVIIACTAWPSDPAPAPVPAALLATSGWRTVAVTWAMSDVEIVAAIGTALMRH